MKNSPLVSIIIPVYNVERYLCECLDSVSNQSYTNIEIICVNDGSPDNSLSILENYAGKDKRFKIISIDNQGLSGARNVGTEASSGDYIMYLDSDDWVDVDTVSFAVSGMQNECVDVVLWNYYKEYDNHNTFVQVFNKEQVFRDKDFFRLMRRLIGLTGEELKHPELSDSISTAWGKLYRRDIIVNNSIRFVSTNEIGTEDLLFNVMYFLKSTTALCIPQGLNHYRKFNPTSLTINFKPQLFEQWSELQYRLETLVGHDKELVSALHNRICLSVIGLGLNEMSSNYKLLKKRKRLNEILSSERYKNSLSLLELRHFNFHWRCFFFCAKYRLILPLMVLLKCINIVIQRG